MHPELLDILVAPAGGGPLKLETDAKGPEVLAGVLVAMDGARFPIRDGVPRMVPEHDSSATTDDGATQRSFGAKWAQYREEEKDQLADFQYQWFDERFGFAGESALKEFLVGKRRILDAGTGPGLCAARCARLSDAHVVGMDLSDSVTAARRRHAEEANLDYVQGDILNPPFAPGTFDFVVADQVLHHTPDCARAFHTMAELVAPGGQIAAYVYRKKALLRELADEHIIDETSRLSVEECLELSEQITELGRELSRLGAKVTLERGVPLLGIEPGEHDVQRLIYWTMLKCFWNEELGWRQSVMINYDWYSPVYRSRHTEEEVLGWCRDAELDVVNLDVIESGISVRAARAL
jgi:SAM-dependent methyltransferase